MSDKPTKKTDAEAPKAAAKQPKEDPRTYKDAPDKPDASTIAQIEV